ncbi:Rad4 transglutaminase-like domain-containing protein [Massariosphaeria phaeospora]|uniref:Rad4 transglutaminase-like domain-containing protein n=1 Tax=Massariosphaeria phaeospora TaxID=100035 RepID=A0A7C8MMW9_9PLEO|nr:Rad4 transglutaminase-like domain-containing protein [Massariosphaeria phaeospora]
MILRHYRTMPPVVPRKRLKSDSPAPEPPPKRAARHTRPRRSKDSVFQSLDAPPNVPRTLSQTKQALAELEDDESALSELESSEDEFEDVVINGAQQATSSKSRGKRKARDVESSEESEVEEWEDALASGRNVEPVPVISGDIELTLSSTATQTAFSSKIDGKTGPSKIQRQIRNVTHRMHVQFLMFHNLIRNAWVQDEQVQKILVENLPVGCWREIERYWRDVGIENGPQRVVKGGLSKKKAEEIQSAPVWKKSTQSGVKVFESPGNKKTSKVGPSSKVKSKETRNSDRKQRDWGASSDRVEPNTPNLSAGDPLLRLLKYLSAYWKSKYNITAPSLRKRGYLSPSTLEAEIGAWRAEPSDPDTFGERVENIGALRDMARNCEGSRDVGQQLFTALLRGLGIEARMVASLQPAGFGFSQSEEGSPKDLEKLKSKAKAPATIPKRHNTARGSRKGDTKGTHETPTHLSDADSSDLSSIISISSGSDDDAKKAKKPRKARKYGDELPHPTYWTEAISHLTHTPIAVSALTRPVIATSAMPDQLVNFYCRGAAADKAKQVFAYIIAFSSDGSAKDVTTRYLPKHQWPGKTKGFRMPVEKIPIHNKRGKVKRWEEWDWAKSVMRPYARWFQKRQPWDGVEDEGDLVAAQAPKPKAMHEEGGKETLQGYKTSAEYVLERHLRREEALKPGAKVVRHFTTGKGDNEKSEAVYRRKDIVSCKTVESWHKEGRAVNEGEQPLKFVPMRAVTVTRKREIEEREREEGGKVKQGLYSKAQTDWIIPDAIVDGKIPRNAFGNIDVYVPTMVPRGAVHIPLRGTVRVCKKLNINFAEACTGFEFGKQRAVPVLTGVVVAAENEDLVIDAWEADQAEKAAKELDKREKLVLGLWKKFFSGLRIVQRMKLEYGDEVALPQKSKVAAGENKEQKSQWDTFHAHEDFEGGFLREETRPGGFVQSEDVAQDDDHDDGERDMAGGFFAAGPDEPLTNDADLTIDHGDDAARDRVTQGADNAYQTPISLHSALQKQDEDQDEDEDEELGDAPDAEAESITAPTARTNKQSRTRASTSRGRGRGRATRPPSPSPSAHPNVSDSEPLRPKPNPRKRKRATPPPRPTPARKSARQSAASVKSHFFAHGSEEETDATVGSPEKKGRGRGRGSGRSRARARGRGRGG